MVEHVLGIPERTTYDRLKKGVVPPVEEEAELEASSTRETKIARIAFALEATSGLSRDDALAEATRIYEMRLRQIIPSF
jgi:hypothetical protein